MLDEADVEALRAVGWGEQAIYEATALIALFNYSGRLEAASGRIWVHGPGMEDREIAVLERIKGI